MPVMATWMLWLRALTTSSSTHRPAMAPLDREPTGAYHTSRAAIRCVVRPMGALPSATSRIAAALMFVHQDQLCAAAQRNGTPEWTPTKDFLFPVYSWGA